MNLSKHTHRVIYADTDHFGVVYYGRYLEWMEAGRAEILRENGITYADYEKKGMYAPVVRLEVDYQRPARYDEVIIIETKIAKIGNSSIEFNYAIKRDEEILANAKTVNVFITKNGEKARVPDQIRKILS